MQELPHYYAVVAYAESAGDAALDSNRLPALPTATPAEFVDGVTQFTDFEIQAHVQLPEGASIDLAQRVLEKAERTCLIANSLKAPVRLKVVTSFLDRSATSSPSFPGLAAVQR
jgi:hypothetical protein